MHFSVQGLMDSWIDYTACLRENESHDVYRRLYDSSMQTVEGFPPKIPFIQFAVSENYGQKQFHPIV